MSEPTSELGQRLRQFRHARGMTQEGLAVAARVSVSMVTRTESGQRFPTVPVLMKLAGALGVGVGELAGRPGADGIHPGVAPLREALVAGDALAGMDVPEKWPPLPLPELQARLAAARRAYWDGRFSELAGMLPDLLHQARASALASEQAYRPMALVRDLAACLLVHFAQHDLAATAAERAVLAAWYAGDQVLHATMRGTFAWVLLHQGRLADAEALAAGAARDVDPSGREAAAARGSLLLTALGPAAAAGNDVSAYLGEAGEMVTAAGGTLPVFNSTFGTALVAMQAVHAYALTGRAAEALRAAAAVRGGELEPISYGRHLLDVAQAYADDGSDQAAIASLDRALQAGSAEWWRQQEVTRLLIADLSERARRVPDTLRRLARVAQGPSGAPYQRPSQNG